MHDTESCAPVAQWADAPPKSIPGEASRGAAIALAARIAESTVALTDVVREAEGRESRSRYTFAQKVLAGDVTSAPMVGRLSAAFDRLTSAPAPQSETTA